MNFDNRSNQNGAPSDRARPVVNKPTTFSNQNETQAQANPPCSLGHSPAAQAGHPIGNGRSFSFATLSAFPMSVGVVCPADDAAGRPALTVASVAWTI